MCVPPPTTSFSLFVQIVLILLRVWIQRSCQNVHASEIVIYLKYVTHMSQMSHMGPLEGLYLND